MENNSCPELDSEVERRLNLFLENSGLHKLSKTVDALCLVNPETLRRLTVKVAEIVDEIAPRIDELLRKKKIEFEKLRLKSQEKNVEVPTKSDLETAHGLVTEESSVHETTEELAMNPNVEDEEIKGDCKTASKDPHH